MSRGKPTMRGAKFEIRVTICDNATMTERSEQKKKRTIIFDFDGTLINSGKEALRRCLRIADSLGLQTGDAMAEKARTYFGFPAGALVDSCWPGADKEEFLRRWAEMDTQEPYALFPGVRETLDKFKNRGMTLVIHTSRRRASTHWQLAHNNVKELFDFIYAVEDTPASKPDPESVFSILRELSSRKISDPHETLFVGDMARTDWEMAKNAKLDFVGVLSGGVSSREEFLALGLAPSRIINSVAELPQWFGWNDKDVLQ